MRVAFRVGPRCQARIVHSVLQIRLRAGMGCIEIASKPVICTVVRQIIDIVACCPSADQPRANGWMSANFGQ